MTFQDLVQRDSGGVLVGWANAPALPRQAAVLLVTENDAWLNVGL